MKKIIITFVLISIFFMISCIKRDVDFLTFSCEIENGMSVYIYEGGNIVQTFNLSSKLEEIKALERILNKKEREWKKSIVSYAPVIKIRGTSLDINIQEERAIVNYKDSSGNFQQIVTKISLDEFKEIKETIMQGRIGVAHFIAEVNSKVPPGPAR